MPADVFQRDLPVAEHGFAALVEVGTGRGRLRVLFDAGVSRTGVLQNLDALGVELGDVKTIVLSHGHADHANGLEGVVKRLGRRALPLVLHPDAALERKLVLPSGFEIGLPAPALDDLAREGVEVVEAAHPSLVIDGAILVSGEVPRTTRFETGLPTHWARRRGVWESDPQILDDQCAVIWLRDRGLVVLTGCSHAGIVNTVRQAIALTGGRAGVRDRRRLPPEQRDLRAAHTRDRRRPRWLRARSPRPRSLHGLRGPAGARGGNAGRVRPERRRNDDPPGRWLGLGVGGRAPTDSGRARGRRARREPRGEPSERHRRNGRLGREERGHDRDDHEPRRDPEPVGGAHGHEPSRDQGDEKEHRAARWPAASRST